MRVVWVPILSLLALATSAAVRRTVPASPGAQTEVPPLVRAYLQERMGFSSEHLRDIARGRAVARVLDADHGEDVSIVGAVRIGAPASWILTRLRDITTFERGQAIIDIVNFSTPPRLSDLDRLVLDEGDITALRTCRPERCDVQLPATLMDRFRESVPWRSPEASARANLLARQVLFEWLETYRAGGLHALGSFDDHGQRRLDEEFAHIVSPGDFPVPLPGFVSMMKDYPKNGLDGIEEAFYWSKFDFGLRPTIRLNHMLLMVTPHQPQGLLAVAATKQLYASHYFTTALELRFVVDDPSRPGYGFYLLYMTKSRVPSLTGFFSSLVRRIIKGRARGAMERHLESTRQAAERGDTFNLPLQ